MTYEVKTEVRPAGDLDGTVYILSDADRGTRAEVWPALGCNCFRWQVTRNGQPLELLYADPQLFQTKVPTRSGIPVLFPFPNRIRAGRYRWAGQVRELARNDSIKQNAIHGWACRRPWRVVDQGADSASAWVQGEFRASVDAADVRDLWPADYTIRITHRLTGNLLRLEIVVENPDQVALPFGLGFHPYFRVPLLPDARVEDCLVECPARAFWELRDSLPTGQRPPVDQARDLTRPRRYPELSLDDVLTDLPPSSGPLRLLGCVRQTPANVGLTVSASPDFREVVGFTPAHRQAVCLEPYTCVTDAINLQPQGIDAGLLVLEPGQHWSATVELLFRQE